MRRFRLALLGFVIVAGMAVTPVAAQAGTTPSAHQVSTITADTPTHSQATYVHCTVAVAKLQPHQSESRVISKKCTPEPSQASKSGSIQPSVSLYCANTGGNGTPLWTGYQYTNYTGNSITFCGTSGPCDASGYHLNDTRPPDYGLSWGISSWQAHSSCWHTTIYYYYNHTGPYWEYQKGVWEAGQIGNATDGTYLGNHVWSVDVWNG